MELYQGRVLSHSFPYCMVFSRAITLMALVFALLPVARSQDSTEINLFFYGARTTLTKKQVVRLDSLLNTVELARIQNVTLVGHTDSLLGRARNIPMAEQRAASVKKLLIERNVPDSLIIMVPFNAPVPVKENLHPKGPTRNRRVFLRVESLPAMLAPPID